MENILASSFMRVRISGEQSVEVLFQSGMVLALINETLDSLLLSICIPRQATNLEPRIFLWLLSQLPTPTPPGCLPAVVQKTRDGLDHLCLILIWTSSTWWSTRTISKTHQHIL